MFAEAYRRGHDRVVSFMEGRDTERHVPACPAWTAADVVRHLTGVSSDIVDGIMDGFASEEWTRSQIEARADLPYAEVVAVWASIIDAAAARLDGVEDLGIPERLPSALGMIPSSSIGPMAISDIVQHEFDLRNAFGDTAGRDLMDIHFVAAGHVRQMRGTFTARELPTIWVEATDSGMGWDIGYDEPVAVLRSTSFQLMRAIGGRRTRDEMLGLGWDGDGAAFVDAMVLPHLSMRDTSLGE
jgi:uncharacterized protein (TIGR03083 family)